MRMCQRSALACLLIAIQLFSCLPIFSTLASGQRRMPPRRPNTPVGVQNNMNQGLQFRLSEGTEPSERRENIPQAVAAKLSDTDTQNVLKRLQPIKADASDEQDAGAGFEHARGQGSEVRGRRTGGRRSSRHYRRWGD